MKRLLHAFVSGTATQLVRPVVVAIAVTSMPLAVAQSSLSETQLLGQASQLMGSNNHQAAYELLIAEEDVFSGSPKYDYLLGLTAIDSGNFDNAVLALQRVTLADPGSAAARMELGRAYFGLGDMALARQEFELLLKSDPPPLAQRIIADYMERIRAAEGAYKSRLLGYVEFEGGYNNNANGATSVNNFLQFQLDDDSRRSPSALYGVAIGGSSATPIAPRWSVQTAVRAAFRNYPNADTVDSQQLAAAAHLQWKRGRSGVRGGVIGQYVRLDNEPNNRAYAVDVSGWRPLSSLWLLRASARVGVSKFDGLVSVRDVSQQFYGLSVARQSPGKRQMQLELSLIGGDEDGLTPNAAGDRPFGRDIYGAQLASSLFLTQNLRAFVSAGWLHSYYDGPFLRDSGTGGGREDDQFVSSLSFVLLEPLNLSDWSLRNEYRYVENISDISLYDYASFQVLITARREFE